MKSTGGMFLLMKILKRLAAFLMFSSVVASFCGLRDFVFAAKLQIVPAMIAMDAAAILLFVLMAAVFGRIYCEVVCPLGIIQDFCRWLARKKVRRVCAKLPSTRIQNMVKWTIFVVFVFIGLWGWSFMWLDPYGVFGRGMMLSGGLFFLVLALALIGKGRFWCNWICPIGTILQLISRKAFVGDRFRKCDHCEECRKCQKR
ncbi:MAG: 4Fe-4S binding protein [Kiritimatiellae bacterium]|nr:4Fe-4S binding protein [Kiritimatiellia bacterium]